MTLIQDGDTTNVCSGISQITHHNLYKYVLIHFHNILVMYELVQTCKLTIISVLEDENDLKSTKSANNHNLLPQKP